MTPSHVRTRLLTLPAASRESLPYWPPTLDVCRAGIGEDTASADAHDPAQASASPDAPQPIEHRHQDGATMGSMRPRVPARMCTANVIPTASLLRRPHGDRRVDPRRAQGRNPARDDPDERHHDRHAGERHRVVRSDTEKESTHDTSHDESTGYA